MAGGSSAARRGAARDRASRAAARRRTAGVSGAGQGGDVLLEYPPRAARSSARSGSCLRFAGPPRPTEEADPVAVEDLADRLVAVAALPQQLRQPPQVGDGVQVQRRLLAPE